MTEEYYHPDWHEPDDGASEEAADHHEHVRTKDRITEMIERTRERRRNRHLDNFEAA